MTTTAASVEGAQDTTAKVSGHGLVGKRIRMPRKNLKISEEAFAELAKDKPDGVTWDYYLTEIRTVE